MYSTHGRMFWALAVVGMGSTLIYMLCKQILLFQTYPTLTKVSVGEVNLLAFPAVTICNLNGMNTRYFTPDIKLRNYLFSKKLDFITDPINWTDPFYSNWKIDEAFMYKMANRLENLIYVAYWQGERINTTHYFTSRMTPNGVCYTFNDASFVKKYGALKTKITGNLAGLVLVINIEQQYFFYGEFNMGAGVKVVLHDPYEEPDIMAMGFTAPPGFTSYVAMRYQKNTYLPPPYSAFKKGVCVDQQSSDFKNPLKYHKHYSYFACFLECENDYVVSRCGCRTFALPGNATICTLREIKECAFPINQQFYLDSRQRKRCGCPRPCEVRHYHTKISSAYFPADGVSSLWLNQTDVRKNHLELRLFYQQLEYDHVQQVAEYDLEGILANLGGQMGLFLGASVLTAAEVLEFLTLHALLIFRKVKARFTSTKVQTVRLGNAPK